MKGLMMKKKRRKKENVLELPVKITREAYDKLWELSQDSARTLGGELSWIVVAEHRKRFRDAAA